MLSHALSRGLILHPVGHARSASTAAAAQTRAGRVVLPSPACAWSTAHTLQSGARAAHTCGTHRVAEEWGGGRCSPARPIGSRCGTRTGLNSGAIVAMHREQPNPARPAGRDPRALLEARSLLRSGSSRRSWSGGGSPTGPPGSRCGRRSAAPRAGPAELVRPPYPSAMVGSCACMCGCDRCTWGGGSNLPLHTVAHRLSSGTPSRPTRHGSSGRGRMASSASSRGRGGILIRRLS